MRRSRMGYLSVAFEGEGANCFSITASHEASFTGQNCDFSSNKLYLLEMQGVHEYGNYKP